MGKSRPRMVDCEVPGPFAEARSRWEYGGARFDVLTWTEEAFKGLSITDRSVIIRSAARRLEDGSWHLLVLEE